MEDVVSLVNPNDILVANRYLNLTILWALKTSTDHYW